MGVSEIESSLTSPHLLGVTAGVDGVDALGAVAKPAVLEVWVVGEVSVGTELDAGQQLHGAREGGARLRRVRHPLHQLHRVRVVELLRRDKWFGLGLGVGLGLGET